LVAKFLVVLTAAVTVGIFAAVADVVGEVLLGLPVFGLAVKPGC
jgi:hypothetical protein